MRDQLTKIGRSVKEDYLLDIGTSWEPRLVPPTALELWIMEHLVTMQSFIVTKMWSAICTTELGLSRRGLGYGNWNWFKQDRANYSRIWISSKEIDKGVKKTHRMKNKWSLDIRFIFHVFSFSGLMLNHSNVVADLACWSSDGLLMAGVWNIM